MSRRNARYQQWSALLASRNKRHRARAFPVQGVRPVDLAVQFGWPLRTVLHGRTDQLSSWAGNVLAEAGGDRVEPSADLLAELGQQDEEVPEVLAVAGIPDDDLQRVPAGPELLLTETLPPVGAQAVALAVTLFVLTLAGAHHAPAAAIALLVVSGSPRPGCH